jgi:hypothetical protein
MIITTNTTAAGNAATTQDRIITFNIQNGVVDVAIQNATSNATIDQFQMQADDFAKLIKVLTDASQ